EPANPNMSESQDGNNQNSGQQKPEVIPPKIMPTKYKFREMKVYSSDEWMAASTKRYRRVFDRFETTYMHVEMSFFNKLFDEEDWDASIRSKSYFVSGSQKNELSNFEEKRKILKDENIVYIRHSWGNAIPGDYWRKGNYVWEGYIDDVKIGEAVFYIEDLGKAVEGENLFFDIDSAHLFEGDAKASGLTEKKYLKKFNGTETHYIWGEFNVKNKTVKDYYAEFIFNFYNSDGQLKGSHPYLIYIAPNTLGQIYTAYASWGSDVAGTWLKDAFTLEVIFMDNLIATIPFQVGDTIEEGSNDIITDMSQLISKVTSASSTPSDPALDVLLNESLAELNAMTGLDNIKNEVNEMVKLVRFYQESGKDVLNKFSLHTVFIGNPGTGKTTVARLLSKIYKGLGILGKGHLVEVDREGLVAGYIGQTAIKTGEKITEAMGGILFIDEAYSLAQEKGSPYDFGGEAIQIILKRMEDLRGKFGVIVAGYTHNMHAFINSNPGLKSRFDKYFTFDDYTPQEMFIIALSMFRNEGVMPDVEAAAHLKDYFSFLYKGRDDHFGNARTVRQVVLESVKNQNLRLAAITKAERTEDMLATVTYEDVKEFELKEDGFEKHIIGFKLGN
ncbi:MAG: AAA family ATPase, partial [Saprospiraceae bacterium]